MTLPLVSIQSAYEMADFVKLLGCIATQTHAFTEILGQRRVNRRRESVLNDYHDPMVSEVCRFGFTIKLPLAAAWSPMGIEPCKGEWVAITDIDVRPEPD